MKGRGTAEPGKGSLKADALAWLILFVAGSTSLAYEICWIRRATLAFGSTVLAVSSVVAVFLLGLALGSRIAGERAGRIAHPIRTAGILQVGLAAAALLTFPGFWLSENVYGLLYPLLIRIPGAGDALRVVLLALTLLPPTALMGAILPLYARQYVRRDTRVSTLSGTLSAVNTAGASVGCVLAGLVLIPAIGVRGTVSLCALINLACGALAFGLPTEAPADTPLARSDTDSAPNRADAIVTQVLFFVAGFTALACEVLWTRFASLVIHNSVHTATLTVGATLVGLALGAVLAARLCEGRGHTSMALGASLALAGLASLGLMMLPAAVWRALAGSLEDGMPWPLFGAFMLPALFSGMTFPLAVRVVASTASQAPRAVGVLSALNLTGSVVGGLAAGFVLLPLFGLQASSIVVAAVSVAGGVVAFISAAGGPAAPVRYAVAAVALVAWAATSFVPATRLPHDYLASDGTLLAVAEGRNSSLAVLRRHNRNVLEMDRLWQGEDQRTHQVMAAHVPALIHGNLKDVLVVGLGVGQTANRFLMYDVKSLDCVEIEPAVIPIIRKRFNGAWLDDSRVRIVIDDGRGFVAHSRGTYDCVSIEVGQMFRPGVSSFYTVDFYRDVAARLKPGGIVSQFLPINVLDRETTVHMVATFLNVFPHAVLWYNTSEFLLIGSRDSVPRLTAASLRRLHGDPAIARDLSFAYWGGNAHYLNHPEVFVAGFMIGSSGLQRMSEGGRIYRDDPPRLEYRMSSGRPGDIHGVLALIEMHQEPFSTITDVPISAEVTKFRKDVRNANLRDILVAAIRDQARKAVNEHRLDDAMRLSDQAMRVNPQSVRTRLLTAELFEKQGRGSDAAALYEDILSLDDREVTALNNLARILIEQRQHEEALSLLEHAVEVDPSDAEANVNLGNLMFSMGRTDEALTLYSRALATFPLHAHAIYNTGYVLLRSGDRAGAMKRWAQLTALQEVDRRILLNTARLLASEPDADDAMLDLALTLARRAVSECGDRDATALDVLATVHAARGDYRAAVASAREAEKQARLAGLDDLASHISERLETYRTRDQSH